MLPGGATLVSTPTHRQLDPKMNAALDWHVSSRMHTRLNLQFPHWVADLFKHLLTLLLVFLGGCSSFGEGFGRALMDKQKQEDTRSCYIRGPSFDGIEQLINTSEQPGPKQGGDLKVLMVHGIGTHLPGYSTRLAENLARELQLDMVDRQPKTIALRLAVKAENFEMASSRGVIRGTPGDSNGTLNVNRYRSKSSSRQMTFYELTWSEITAADKEIMTFDDSGEYAFRRAGVNRDLKQFVNSSLPDPLIYLGDAQLNIQLSVSQALCWMFARDYEQIPQRSDEICSFEEHMPTEVRKDNYVFVSHSLGSRILTDSLQLVTASMAALEKQQSVSANAIEWREALRDQQLTIFMLSNQLPLLQLGRDAPQVTNQYEDYCTASGKNHDKRVFDKAQIVAFSDPNDILSWAVPPGYEDNNIDSRLCPSLVNIIINIAQVKSVFGLELASPGDAHRGYDNDERVIKLVAHGMNNTAPDPTLKDRCEWLEVQ